MTVAQSAGISKYFCQNDLVRNIIQNVQQCKDSENSICQNHYEIYFISITLALVALRPLDCQSAQN